MKIPRTEIAKKMTIMIILIYCTNNFPTNDNNYNKYDDSTIYLLENDTLLQASH